MYMYLRRYGPISNFSKLSQNNVDFLEILIYLDSWTKIFKNDLKKTVFCPKCMFLTRYGQNTTFLKKSFPRNINTFGDMDKKTVL